MFGISAFVTLGLASLWSLTAKAASQSILRIDNGTYGPELEEVHYYYGMALRSGSSWQIAQC